MLLERPVACDTARLASENIDQSRRIIFTRWALDQAVSEQGMKSDCFGSKHGIWVFRNRV